MMIWAILILTSIWSLILGALANVNSEAKDAARQVLKRKRPAGVVPLGCALAVIPWAIAACWIVYSVQVSDLRFAAIAVLPKLASALVELAKPKAAPDVQS